MGFLCFAPFQRPNVNVTVNYFGAPPPMTDCGESCRQAHERSLTKHRLSGCMCDECRPDAQRTAGGIAGGEPPFIGHRAFEQHPGFGGFIDRPETVRRDRRSLWRHSWTGRGDETGPAQRWSRPFFPALSAPPRIASPSLSPPPPQPRVVPNRMPSLPRPRVSSIPVYYPSAARNAGWVNRPDLLPDHPPRRATPDMAELSRPATPATPSPRPTPVVVAWSSPEIPLKVRARTDHPNKGHYRRSVPVPVPVSPPSPGTGYGSEPRSTLESSSSSDDDDNDEMVADDAISIISPLPETYVHESTAGVFGSVTGGQITE